MQDLKIRVYNYFLQLLDDKLQIISCDLQDLHMSASNETKSTAGDKHETALAILQIEQANKRKQKDELLAQKAAMDKIDPSIQTVSVVQGSLVKTKLHYYFLSAALGKMQLDEDMVYAVSAQSPVAQQMMGLKKGDRFFINNKAQVVEDIA